MVGCKLLEEHSDKERSMVRDWWPRRISIDSSASPCVWIFTPRSIAAPGSPLSWTKWSPDDKLIFFCIFCLYINRSLSMTLWRSPFSNKHRSYYSRSVKLYKILKLQKMMTNLKAWWPHQFWYVHYCLHDNSIYFDREGKSCLDIGWK